ncbi:MAG TPA: glycoside hydrolase family 28 protein [Pirellulales bacterium]|nr:glycoside hydrolase family 28 protein [Pirellulales bacterium]
MPAATAPDWPADVNPALPKIPDRTFNLQDFGGVGDGKTWNTQAFKDAIAKVKQSGGGRLIVPAGVYRTLPFELCSQLDLHLEEGAVIQAPGTFADYDLPEPSTLTTQEEVRQKVKAPPPLISGTSLHDVALTGSGTIDGAGQIWWPWTERATRTQPGRIIYPRMKLVVINGCQRLHVDGITIRNSPQFHLVPIDVTDLLIENVKLQAPATAQNTDAIDPTNCSNVLIRNCEIDVGDDNIVIKSGGHDILIEDCRILHGHGISIGSGTTNGIHNMLVRRCTMEGTDNGIRIKSMRGAGGAVKHIRYEDIQMKDVHYAFVFDLLYMDDARPNFRGEPNKIPSMRDVEICNVKVESAKDAGRIWGLPESPISGITFRNVQITADTDFKQQDAHDITYENVTRHIKDASDSKPSDNKPGDEHAGDHS